MNATPALDELQRQRRDRGRKLAWSAVIVAVAVLAVVGLFQIADGASQARRADALARAEATVRRETRVLHLLWGQTLETIGLLQGTAADIVRAGQRGDMAGMARLRERLLTLIEAAPGDDIVQVGAIGPDGIMLWTSVPSGPGPVNLREREHFRVFADPSLDSFISQPVLGKVSGQWTVQFARAVRDNDRKLLAVTVVSFRSDAVRRFLSALSLGDTESFGVWRSDGSPMGAVLAGKPRADIHAWAPADCQAAEPVTTIAPTPADGVRRILALECVPQSGTMVGVALDEAAWLAWAETAAGNIRRIADLASVLIVVAAGLAIRTLHQAFDARRAARRAAELQADQALFHDLLDNIGDLLVKSAGVGRVIEYASPGARTLLGYDPQSLVGKSLRDLTYPADLPLVDARAQSMADGGDPGRVELRYMRANGLPVWVEVESVMVHRAGSVVFYTVVRDVSERHAAQVAAEKARAEIEEIVAFGPGVLSRFEVLPDGTYRPLYVSPNLKQISGITPIDALSENGMITRSLTYLGPMVEAKLAASLTPGRAVVEFSNLFADGVLHWRRAHIRRLELPDGRREEIWYVVDITDLHAAEAARRAAELRLAELVERSPAVLFQYVIETDGQLWRNYHSPNMTQLTGYPQDFVDREDAWASMVDPGTVARWPAVRDTAIATGAAQWEYEIICADGSRKLMLSSCRAEKVDAGWLLTGSMLDITAQRKVERELEQTRRDLQASVEAGPGVLLRILLHPLRAPEVLAVAGAVERLTGYAAQDALVAGWLQRIIDPDESEAVAKCQRTGLAFEPCGVELRIRTRDGDWRWMQFTLRPLERMADGGVVMVAYVLDITQKKEQDARILHNAKLATLGEMATSLAHELNQPLAIMSMAAENALRDLAVPERTDSVMRRLDRIHAQAMRASRLIDHLRVFGRTQEGGITRLALPDVIEGALLLGSAKLRHSSVQIHTYIPGDLPQVRGNLVLLEQVLLNLISNACDAYESAEAGIPMENRVLDLTAQAVDGHVLLSVADKAGGIPPAIADRVFEPFFTTKSESKGTGVGLSFSYGIIADMGGTLRTYNKDGGAVFEIALLMDSGQPAKAALA